MFLQTDLHSAYVSDTSLFLKLIIFHVSPTTAFDPELYSEILSKLGEKLDVTFVGTSLKRKLMTCQTAVIP